VLGQHVQCVYKDWEKGQWLPTVACAILKQLTKQPMKELKEDFKRYVDQITQNVIALLHICHLKNLNQDQSYRSVKIKKLRCVVERVRCMWPSLNAKQKNELHTLCVDH
jgi:hypothetical protein